MSLLRGLFVGVGLLAVVALLFVWFALPPILGGVAAGLLRDAGLRAADLRVDVGADPPLRLVDLRADRVRVRATDVAIDALRADSVDVTLREVSLRDQTFEVIEGRLDGVRFTPEEGPTIEADSVQVSGPPARALMTMTLSEERVSALVRSIAARSFGVEAGDVQLEAPDRLTFDLASKPVSGRLRIDDRGRLVFIEDRAPAAMFEIFGAGPSDPLELRTVRVDGEDLEVTGTLNLLQGR